MKGLNGVFLVAVLGASLVSGPLQAREQGRIEKDFSGVEAIVMRTLIGGCKIEKSEDGDVHLTIDHLCFDADFEAVFRFEEGTLFLDEKIIWDSDDLAGSSVWVLRVPEGVKVTFHSIMGSCLASELAFDMDLSTATGEVALARCRGDFSILSGTGEIRILDCEGNFYLSSGTGNISIAGSEGSFELASEEGEILVDGLTLDRKKDFSSLIRSTPGRRFSPFGCDDISMSTETGKSVVN